MAALAIYQTTIGKKVIMAVTGLILVGYVIIHMLGNLKAFEGPAKINAYGAFLRIVGEPFLGSEQGLWMARIVLLVAAVLHIWSAVQLWQLDVASRPIQYRTKRTVSASLAARTMRLGGVILAAFIVFHILHFTTGTLLPGFRYGDVYGNLQLAFRNPLVTLFYVVAMVALGFHLYHGVWSVFQTLGLNNRGRNRYFGGLATVVSVVVSVGFVLVPLAVLLGLLR